MALLLDTTIANNLILIQARPPQHLRKSLMRGNLHDLEFGTNMFNDPSQITGFDGGA